MITRKLYQHIASTVQARLSCQERGNKEWFARHTETIEKLVSEHMPSGSGINAGTTIFLGLSTPEKLMFRTSFQHMEEGSYDGWTEHTITVKPSLAFGIHITISGPNRNEIKDYLHEVFSHALQAEVTL